MIETFEEETKDRLAMLKELFEGERERIKNENVEELESMKHDLIKKIEELDLSFESNFN